MKNLLLILSVIMIGVCVEAQNVNKRLITRLTEEGSMYFIRQQELKELSKGVGGFEYDVTYIETRDSVTINFTVESGNATNVSRLTLKGDGIEVEAGSLELLYHDIDDDMYDVRTTSKITYVELKKLMSSATPVEFVMKRADGQENRAAYSKKQWKKERAMYERIFYMINK